MSKIMAVVLLIVFILSSISSVCATSLYDEATYVGLVADVTARKVGESLTVIIVESSSAETASGASTDRSAGLAGSISGTNNTESIGINASANFDDDGEVSRSGKLLAKVTVTIQEVLPTSELRVKGEQIIIINGEEQTISLEGNVRPEDIQANNSVLSTRLANAKITYTGEGILGGKPGIITQFFRWLF